MKVRGPVISIIIPAYNAQNTLRKCIRSVLRQTYKNYELIIIDDGSGDGTASIGDFYAEKYSNVHVVHSENRGVSGARNLGMERAIGDYIMFLDADDGLAARALESMVPYTMNTEWVIGNYVLADEKSGKKIYNSWLFLENIHEGNPNELFELAESRIFNFVWGKLYDQRILKKYQIHFDEKLSYGEDILFNTHYFIHINKFFALQKVVYCYNCHLTPRLSNRVANEWEIQKKICHEMQKIFSTAGNINFETKCKMNHFYYAQCIASVERMVQQRNQREMLEILRDPFFLDILQKEKSAKRIHNLDYWLLKSRKGYVYSWIHSVYVKIKSLKETTQ